MGVPVQVGLALASIASSAYSAKKTSDEQKKARRAQEEATLKQEEALKAKGPEAQDVSETGTDAARLRRLRAGILGNIKAGGLGSSALTAGTALLSTGPISGGKRKLGD